MNLILHIGLTKTGSSALQTFLAMNRALLQEYGFFYPESNADVRAMSGMKTSGNIILKNESWDKPLLKLAEESKFENLVFSNENLCSQLFKHKEKLLSLASRFTLCVVVFVREPIEHAISSYSQAVKEHGEIRPIDAWLEKYRFLDGVDESIEFLNSRNIKFKLIKYQRSDLIRRFSEYLLGHNVDNFIDKSNNHYGSVNRSLTRFENDLIRNLNIELDKSTVREIIDFLSLKTPDTKPEKEYIEDEVLQEFIDKHKDKVSFINQYLDAKNQLTLEKPTDIKPKNDLFEISSKQISVLAEVISKQINRASNARLENNDADHLRDIALKFESKKALTIEDAYYLMGLAHKARPEGPVIKHKLDQYDQKRK